MKRRALTAALLLAAGVLMGQAIKPTDAELANVDKDLAGSDAGAKAAAINTIKSWVKGGFVSDHTWRQWIPQMVKDDKQQEIADIALEAILHRPDPAAIVPLMQFRNQAFLALKKNTEALEVARCYFNVVEMKNSSRGIDAITTALARARPDDAEIVRKFRAEQTAAAQNGGKGVPDDGIMKGIKIDKAPYEATLKIYSAKTVFRDRIAYADLLLVSDQGAEAEKVFRELYQTADPGDQLNQAIEGIAKAIRAQDGSATRAAAWYKVAMEQAGTQTAPAPKPAASTATKPANPDRP